MSIVEKVAISAEQLGIEDKELRAVADRVALAALYNGQVGVAERVELAAELRTALVDCLHRYVRPGSK
jgi:hypothetical protein